MSHIDNRHLVPAGAARRSHSLRCPPGRQGRPELEERRRAGSAPVGPVRFAGMSPESVGPSAWPPQRRRSRCSPCSRYCSSTTSNLRRETLAVSVVLLGGEALLITLAQAPGVSPIVGFPVASACATATGLALVRSRLGTLLADTFQSQPFSSAV
jgi:hypothetical protein